MCRIRLLLTCAGMAVSIYVYSNSSHVLDEALFALLFDLFLQNQRPSGKAEHLHTNARDLTWQDFTAASIRIRIVTDARLDTSIQHIESGLAAYIVCIHFGANTGAQTAHATLDSKVFASPEALLPKQMLAVTNLVNNNNTVTPIILSVGGQTVLQPAKLVANGYVLA